MEVDSSADSKSNSSDSEDSYKKHKYKKSKKHKEKKLKKQKKSKSKSSKRRKRYSSSSDGDDGSSGSGSGSEEEQWIEATTTSEKVITEKKSKSKPKPEASLPAATAPDAEAEAAAVVPPKPPRRKEDDDEEWSTFGNLPTFSNDSRRSQKQKKREEERQLSSIDRAGQHDRELNPYWKDGGKGLPAQEAESLKPKAKGAVGDGGLAWLKKSFQRAKQQAQEDGKPLEEIVAQRWGSLEAFYALLEEAENKARGESSSSRSTHRRDEDDRDRRKSFKKPSRYSDSDNDDDERHSHSHRRRSSRESSPYSRDRDCHRGRNDHRHRDRDRDSFRHSRRPLENKTPGWMKPGAEKKTLPVTSNPVETTHGKSQPQASSSSSLRNVPVPVPHKRESESEPEDMDEDGEDSLKPEEPKVQVLTDKEMNELNAKLFKAEMLGNTDTVEELKNKIQEAEKLRQEYIKDGKVIGDKPTKVITKIIMGNQNPRRRTKDKPTESHKSGERVRYFPDDDRQTLKSMFEREKLNTVEDENALFSKLITKGSKATEDYDVDDIFVDKASSSRQEMKDRKREIQNVFDEEKAHKKVLEDCQWCFDGKHLQKNLVISIGQSSFLCVPPYQSLTEGHCLIVPMFHVTCATELDEDVWAEFKKFQNALVRMHRALDQDVVFFETALYLKKQPHMYIECVPMPKESGDLAPIYFKKAIQECETEWSQNKKVVDLKNRDVRRAVPKGLPYFSVEFADDNCGFAHVVEDEKNFPRNFAQEIIGGMLELDHHLWRKQKKDDFQTQRNKLMSFLTMWGPYDWTRGETSDS